MKLWILVSLAAQLEGAVHEVADPADEPLFRMLPDIPTAVQSTDRFANNNLTAAMEGYEAQVASEQARAAGAAEEAARGHLEAGATELRIAEAAALAALHAKQVETTQGQVEAVSRTAKELAAMIPDIAKKAAQRAAADVLAETLQKMNAEVAEVALSHARRPRLAQSAADRAQAAAQPYQQAKLQAMQTMYSYVEHARELAAAVALLRAKAVEIAKTSIHPQEHGDVVTAQQLQMQAHDLLDKASQMADQARQLDLTAAKIRNQLNRFDEGAQAAAAYAAYQANPGGLDFEEELPEPPYPLSLPAAVPLSGAPAPAPAMAI